MIPLYSRDMHDFVMRALEVGELVAAAEDDEACGFGPLFDVQVARHAVPDRLFGVGYEDRARWLR